MEYLFHFSILEEAFNLRALSVATPASHRCAFHLSQYSLVHPCDSAGENNIWSLFPPSSGPQPLVSFHRKRILRLNPGRVLWGIIVNLEWGDGGPQKSWDEMQPPESTDRSEILTAPHPPDKERLVLRKKSWEKVVSKMLSAFSFPIEGEFFLSNNYFSIRHFFLRIQELLTVTVIFTTWLVASLGSESPELTPLLWVSCH